MSGRSPSCTLPLLAVLVASCAAPPTSPAPTPLDPPLATAISEDGKHRLELLGIQRLPRGLRAPESTLNAQFRIVLGPDELLAAERPVLAVERSDGRRVARASTEDIGGRVWIGSQAEGSWAQHFDAGGEEERLSTLACEVAVLRVRSWETIEAVARADGASSSPDRPPFRVEVTAGRMVCEVGISGQVPGVVDAPCIEETLDVRDATGLRLQRLTACGDDDSYDGSYTSAHPPLGVPAPIAHPVTARIRVPASYEIERVRFEFRDLEVPVKQGGILRHLDAIPFGAPSPHLHEWTGWSEPVRGLSIRAELPTDARRGDDVLASLLVRFDPTAVPAGTTNFYESDLDDRVLLRFRNPATGVTVDLDQDDEQRARTDPDWDAPSTPGTFDGRLAMDEAVVRRWDFWFSLARVPEALTPGEWEVRAVLRAERDERFPSEWWGEAVTPPLRLRMEDPGPRRVILRVPTALCVRPGSDTRLPEIAFGPRESDVVEIETRPGFACGRRIVVLPDESESSSHGLPFFDMDTVVDRLTEEETRGPLDRTYVIEYFEVRPRSSGFSPGVDGYRTLWKESFRVTAATEELEALRR